MKNWKKRPGSFDSLHFEQTFPSRNDFGFPDLLPQPTDLSIPENLKPYGFRQKIRTSRPVLLHFFLDDYRFEIVWNEPRRGIAAACRDQIWATCSPDFSLWSDMPQVMQMWNVYRSRWCARLWQEQGTVIIPTVSWSTLASFAFCFSGIPKNQIVALRTMKRLLADEKKLFLEGYEAMVKELEPRHIIWFGSMHEISDSIPKTVLDLYKKEENDGRPRKLQQGDETTKGDICSYIIN